jgi:hypothetical protein
MGFKTRKKKKENRFRGKVLTEPLSSNDWGLGKHPNIQSKRPLPRNNSNVFTVSVPVPFSVRPVVLSRGSKQSVTALARTSSNSKLQTRPLVREGAIK